MKNLLSRYCAVGAAITLLAACSETISDVQFENWEPEIAAPVLDTRFTLRDALADSDFTEYLTEDVNSAVRIRVSQQLFDVVPGDMLAVPDIIIPLLENETTFNLADQGIELGVSRMDLVGGQLKYVFRNDYPTDAVVTVTSDLWIVNGEGTQHTFTVPALSTTADSVTLNSARLIVPSSGDVRVTYTAILPSGQNVQLTGGTVNFTGNDFSYAEGKLNSIELDLGIDSIATDYFDAFEVGTVGLVDPNARVIVENEVGVPLQLVAQEAFARTRDNERIELNTELTDGFTVEFPSLAEGKLNKNSELIVDKDNSNFVDVLNGFPESLTFGLDANANPEDLDEKFFIHRDARVKGTFEMDIPLALEFNGFKLEQDFAFDGSSISEATEAAFLLRVDNGFGLQATTQVYFYNRRDELIDSLFATPEIVIAAPVVDEFGAPTSSVEKVTEVTIDATKIANIANSRNARVEVTLQSPTTGAQYTQLFFDNSIGVQLGARVTVKPL